MIGPFLQEAIRQSLAAAFVLGQSGWLAFSQINPDIWPRD